jgi:hypothetical protein
MYGCRHELNKRAETFCFVDVLLDGEIFGQCGTQLVTVHLPLLPRQKIVF